MTNVATKSYGIAWVDVIGYPDPANGHGVCLANIPSRVNFNMRQTERRRKNQPRTGKRAAADDTYLLDAGSPDPIWNTD